MNIHDHILFKMCPPCSQRSCFKRWHVLQYTLRVYPSMFDVSDGHLYFVLNTTNSRRSRNRRWLRYTLMKGSGIGAADHEALSKRKSKKQWLAPASPFNTFEAPRRYVLCDTNQCSLPFVFYSSKCVIPNFSGGNEPVARWIQTSSHQLRTRCLLLVEVCDAKLFGCREDRRHHHNDNAEC